MCAHAPGWAGSLETLISSISVEEILYHSVPGWSFLSQWWTCCLSKWWQSTPEKGNPSVLICERFVQSTRLICLGAVKLQLVPGMGPDGALILVHVIWNFLRICEIDWIPPKTSPAPGKYAGCKLMNWILIPERSTRDAWNTCSSLPLVCVHEVLASFYL